MNLAVGCDKCKIKNYCEKYGSSPLEVNNVKYPCHIINGYGREELPASKVGKSSKDWSEKGKALTIVEHPTIIDEIFLYEVIKVFHPPIKHDREKNIKPLSYHPKNHK
jgi:hypothetical protein